MRSAIGWLVLGLVGCSPIAPPQSLTDVKGELEGPAARRAALASPYVYADAKRLTAEAEAAFADDDFAGAQVMAEEAQAALQEAIAVARLVRAEKARAELRQDVATSEARLAELDAAHQKVDAELSVLGKRLDILQNSLVPAPAGKAGPERRRARRRAAEAIGMRAEMLCMAASLLSGEAKNPPAAKERAAAAKQQEALRTALAVADSAPIDEAYRARSACLSALYATRRAVEAKAVSSSDAWLDELSREVVDARVQRDERGVIVSIGADHFTAAGLDEAGDQTLEAIVKVAKRHPTPAVMVVAHGAAASAGRGRALVKRLRASLGAARVADLVTAGEKLPLVDPKGPYAARNARCEVIFVIGGER
ncbi:MAG: hypothetical protein AAGA56_09360 [Myxococcota bacterium]